MIGISNSVSRRVSLWLSRVRIGLSSLMSLGSFVELASTFPKVPSISTSGRLCITLDISVYSYALAAASSPKVVRTLLSSCSNPLGLSYSNSCI